LYSVALKHLVIVDVIVVAAGFVLRAVGGAVAIDVEISGWLLICTILIALFLALGKRRHEYLGLGGGAATHRPILAEYSAELLDQMIAVVTASSVTAYALYTMSPETVAKFHTHLLPATLPFVLYGIFRYLYLLYRRQLGGNPSELFLHDWPLLLNTFLWFLTVLIIIYGTAPAGAGRGVKYPLDVQPGRRPPYPSRDRRGGLRPPHAAGQARSDPAAGSGSGPQAQSLVDEVLPGVLEPAVAGRRRRDD